MSLKRNIIANYISQFYVSILGVAIVPKYLAFMGPEAYGLVGLFAMLQAWFNILDFGLTPTVARETARYNAGAVDATSYRQLVRALETIFIVIGISGCILMLSSVELIAIRWLKVQSLPLSEVSYALKTMIFCVALRWLAGLYRGVISGAEKLVWLGWYNIIVATLRFVGVLIALKIAGPSPRVFFTYQFFVAVFELVCLVSKSGKLLPKLAPKVRIGWSIYPVKRIIKFSLSIAFTSAAWVLITQTDKLVLSGILSLTNYAYFSLAVLVSSTILLTAGPIGTALIPRMAHLEAQHNHDGLLELYRNATQLVCMIALPVAFTLAAFAEPVLWAWTNDKAAAEYAAPILSLYVIGNAVMVIAAFPYYYQYAKGDLRLHLVGNIIFLVFLIPSLIYATTTFGAVGAGIVWLTANAGTFLIWVPIAHARLQRGLHSKWIVKDIVPIATAAGICACLSSLPGFDWSSSRWKAILVPISVGLSTLAITAAASSKFRAEFKNVYRKQLYKNI